MKIPLWFIKITLALSGTAVAVINSNSIKRGLINGFISFALWCFLFFKTNILKRIFSENFNWQRFIVSLILSAGTVSCWIVNSRMITLIKNTGDLIEKANRYLSVSGEYNNVITVFSHIGVWILGVLSAAAVSIYLYWFLGFLLTAARALVSDIKKHEIWYLSIISIILVVSVGAVFCVTAVFYKPVINGDIIRWDVIFTADSPVYFTTNGYLSIVAPENDIRQPLFGLFAMPFGGFAALASKLFFFASNAYPVIIQALQAVLLQITVVMLARMAGMKSFSSIAFCMLFTVSYPYLLFTLMPEQYIFSVFWMFLLLYAWFNKDKFRIRNGRKIFFITAAGTLITNGILFPCALSKKGKDAVKEIAALGVVFLLVVVLCGQGDLLWDSIRRIRILKDNFTTGGIVSLHDRLLQYVNFAALCLIKPAVVFATKQYFLSLQLVPVTFPITKLDFVSCQLAPVTSLNYAGVFFLIIAIAAFVINRKNRFAQVCAAWIGYSFIILCAAGWGTIENGLVLYSLYFAWAFLALLCMGIEKIRGRLTPLKYGVYAVLIVYLAFINIPAIADIVRFGITYYPAK